RYVYLRRRGDTLVCTQTPTPLGPIRSRTRARLGCRALDGASAEELESPELALPRLRTRLRHLADCRRYEDAARLRDRIGALEQLDAALADLLRPVACDLVTCGELAQRRDLLAAARRLYERTARVEAAGGRRVRGAGQVAGKQDRFALPLDDRVRDRHR